MTRQERAVRTREALIEAAADLFDRDGQEVTSLAAVTAKAQVSAGALYFHFATKADLADAVTRTALARLRQITGAPAATPADTNKNANKNANGNANGSGSGSEGGGGSRNGGGGGSGWGGDALTQAARGVRGERGAGAPPVRGPAAAAGAARGDRVGEVQQLIDTTHVLVRGLADDVVLRAGFALDRAGAGRPARERPAGEGPAARAPGGGTGGERSGRWPEVGGSLRGVWSGWVHETLAAAGARGALAAGVSPGDAAAVVVAATVGFEVLGAQDPLWLAPHRLTRFWTLLLPALVPPPAREALQPGGSPAAH
ncbi:TetR family transcriptional regulator [Streptomyces sp. NPDC048508]|uniref:TetR family transcriptional regulator n=1 Tax=Streptomyces sp. NPDC048508 TaxID=3365561 RepID=UPI0037229247